MPFALTAFVAALLLFLPGGLALWGLGRGKVESAACGPLLSYAAYGVTCVAYGMAGIACSWENVALPALAVGAVLAAARFVRRRREGAEGALAYYSTQPISTFFKSDFVCLCLYIVVGLLATSLVFLSNLPDASSVNQYYDNHYHIERIETMMRSGVWSSLQSSVYAASDMSPSTASASGFYPSAWHAVCAMSALVAGVGPAVAENAVNAVTIALVLPSSFFMMMRGLFRSRRAIAWFGAIFVLASGAFPWRIISFGPLFPFLASMSVAPAAVFFFMAVFQEGVRPLRRAVAGAVFFVGLVSLAFTQPSSVFLLAVFLAPYCVYLVVMGVGRLKLPPVPRVLAQVGAALVFAAFVAAVWMALYGSSFMKNIVEYSWPTFLTVKEAVEYTSRFELQSLPRQRLTALLVLAGMLWTLKHRKHLWLCFPALAFAFMYVLDASTTGALRHILTGFWYTDPYRVASCLVFSSVPLMALGLYAAGSLVVAAIGWARSKGEAKGSHSADTGKRRVSQGAAKVAVFAVLWCGMLWYVYSPPLLTRIGVPTNSSLTVVSDYIRGDYDNMDHGTYDGEEQKFVSKVREIIGDELVINIPMDGSALAYGVDGLNAYYRSIDSSISDETADSKAIRTRLHQVATDEEVQQALRNIDARYVLLLDSDHEDQHGVIVPERLTENFSGIYAIDDTTPGFRPVYTKGDMRLYEVL